MGIVFHLTKNVNSDLSMIRLSIHGVIFRFLKQYEHRINVDLSKLLKIKVNDFIYFYEEEVQEIREISKDLLNELKSGRLDHNIVEYRERYGLTEDDISKEDLIELALHLCHLCDTTLSTGKLLVAYGSVFDWISTGD
jgi:hypothetical protein